MPALLAAGAEPSGPVVVDVHTSADPPEIFAMTSSAAGTLYGSDRKGGNRTYFRPAPLASGTLDSDLGPVTGADASVVGDKILVPVFSDSADRVTEVRWCTTNACAATALIPLSTTEVYVANTGTGVLVYATDGTRQLRIKRFAGGTPQVVGALPPEPADPTRVEGQADATGAVLDVDGYTMYVHFATATVTALSSGGEPLWASGVALSPGFLARQFFDGSATVISRVSRTALGAPPVTFTAASDAIDAMRITDTGTAWFVQEPSGTTQRLFTRTAGGATTVEYIRLLSGRALAQFEDTSDFIIADRMAPTPGFYRLAPGASSGTFVGVLGARYARTAGLALSHDRVLYSNDSADGDPIFLRDVSALPTLGGETTVSAASANEGYTMDLSGPFVAFTRPNAATPSRTDVVYGRPGSALSAFTLPVGEDAWSIQVSGERALVMGNVANRLLDLVTGAVSTVPRGVYARLWGDQLVTLGVDTALLQRRNLATGAVATIRAADPACGPNCVDDDSQDLTVWGNQVAYRFLGAGGVVRSGLWTATSATTGTTVPLPAPPANHVSLRLGDGLLLATEYPDVVRLYDLRSATSALVDPSGRGFEVDGYRVASVAFSDFRGRVADVRRYLPAYTLSAPRLLNASTAAGLAADSNGTARWQPRFYATRDVSWKLEIRAGGATGTLVRSFSDTSVLGEITPAGGWDGTDGFGALVPQGSYTWRLTGTAGTQPLTTADGGTTLSGTIYVSRTAPALPLVTAPARSTDTSTTTSFAISWQSPGAPAGTRYTVRTSINGGAYSTLLSGTAATSATVSAAAGQTRRFRVTATDPAGRVSGAGTALTVVPFDSASAAASGTWSTVSSANRFLGSVRSSAAAGGTMSFTSTGTSISIIGDRGPTTGQFQVSYDGGPYSAFIDTTATAPSVRSVLTTKSFPAPASSHTVKVRVVGTPGRPAIGIDGFAYKR